MQVKNVAMDEMGHEDKEIVLNRDRMSNMISEMRLMDMSMDMGKQWMD